MDLLFLDEPTLPCREYLEKNNINRVLKPYYAIPKDLEAVYLHRNVLNWDCYPNLKHIICPMTGIKHLEGRPKNTIVYYLDNKQWLFDNVWSTAEHTLSLLLRILRGLSRELTESRVGILGFGRIGQQMYQFLQGFNCKIKWFDPNEVYYTNIPNALKVDDPASVFNDVDVVLIHMAETSLTKGMVDYKLLRNCNDQPVIMNTARTSLIKYTDLIESLETGGIMGFGLDVDIDEIPEGSRNKILDFDRIYRGVIVTDHIAGKSLKSRLRTDAYVLEKFIKSLGGTSYENNTGLL